MRKILVTGGTTFVSKYTAKYFAGKAMKYMLLIATAEIKLIM